MHNFWTESISDVFLLRFAKPERAERLEVRFLVVWPMDLLHILTATVDLRNNAETGEEQHEKHDGRDPPVLTAVNIVEATKP